MKEMILALYDREDKIAYQTLQQLEKISEESNKVYFFIEEFLEMLKNEKSYIRVRGFRLICKNAKWDDKNKINSNIELILSLLEDKKAYVIRQCVQVIKELLLAKPELREKIKEKLLHIDYLKYPESMQSLIWKDVDTLLKQIENQ